MSPSAPLPFGADPLSPGRPGPCRTLSGVSGLHPADSSPGENPPLSWTVLCCGGERPDSPGPHAVTAETRDQWTLLCSPDYPVTLTALRRGKRQLFLSASEAHVRTSQHKLRTEWLASRPHGDSLHLCVWEILLLSPNAFPLPRAQGPLRRRPIDRDLYKRTV